MPNEPNEPTIVEESGPQNIADGLADHMLLSKNSECRDIVTASTSKKFLVNLIKEYFDSLGGIEETYGRQQMLNDLILMVKGGSAAAAKQVTDMLGLDNASEVYDINLISFEDYQIDEDFFKVK